MQIAAGTAPARRAPAAERQAPGKPGASTAPREGGGRLSLSGREGETRGGPPGKVDPGKKTASPVRPGFTLHTRVPPSTCGNRCLQPRFLKSSILHRHQKPIGVKHTTSTRAASPQRTRTVAHLAGPASSCTVAGCLGVPDAVKPSSTKASPPYPFPSGSYRLHSIVCISGLPLWVGLCFSVGFCWMRFINPCSYSAEQCFPPILQPLLIRAAGNLTSPATSPRALVPIKSTRAATP